MDKVFNNLKMVTSIKVIMRTATHKVLVNIIGKTETYIKGNLLKD